MARPPITMSGHGLDLRTKSVYEILGSYFTDVLFNSVYSSAFSNVSAGMSCTDEYVSRLKAYVLGVKTDPNLYSKVIQNVHNYFTTMTSYSTINFSRFVDAIIEVTVPREFFGDLQSKDKDEFLSSIVCDLVSHMAVYAAGPALRRIIDMRGSPTDAGVTHRMMIDNAIDILVSKRSDIRNKFLKKVAQARETVSSDVLDNVKAVVRRLVQEKAEVSAKLATALAELESCRTRLHAEHVVGSKLRRTIELLTQGQSIGPAAAGRLPRPSRHDTIAELEPPRHPRHIPRDTIGEADADDNNARGGHDEPAAPAEPSSNESSSDESSSDEQDTKRKHVRHAPVKGARRHHRGAARKGSPAPAAFFRSTAPASPRVGQPAGQPASRPASPLAPSAERPAPKPMPALMQSMLNYVEEE